MKSVAFIFVLIFSIALLAPDVATFCNNESTIYFNADEGNGNSQKPNYEDEKKDKLFYSFIYDNKMTKNKSEICSSDNFTIHSPFLGIVTPPPDNC